MTTLRVSVILTPITRDPRIMLFSVSQHGMFEGESSAANVAFVGFLPSVSSNMTPEVLGRPKFPHAKQATHSAICVVRELTSEGIKSVLDVVIGRGS